MSRALQHRQRQSGASLIELMVGILVGLIVLSAITVFVTNNLQANKQSVDAAKLNQDLRIALDLMARDLRRANYSPTMQGQLTTNSSALLPSTVSLSDCSADNTCKTVTYAYSNTTKVITLNNSGSITLQIGAGTAQPLTDNLVSNITNLSFCFINTQGDTDPTNDTCNTSVPTSYTLSVSGVTQVVKIHLLRIAVTGQLKSDSSITKTINETVRIRNDSFSN